MDPGVLASLLHSTGQGSAEAFAALVTATEKWALAHAYAVLRDRARAEDCVQLSFLEVWQTAHRYDRTKGGAKGWLRSLIRHRATDQVRANESDRRRLEAYETLELRRSEGVDTTLEAVHAIMDGYVVREALRHLTPEQRHLIRLSYWSGLSHSQIAELTGLPLGTVKSRLRTGLQTLRESVTITRTDE